MLVRHSSNAEQDGLCVKVGMELAQYVFRKCVFKSSTPVVRKDGAREI